MLFDIGCEKTPGISKWEYRNRGLPQRWGSLFMGVFFRARVKCAKGQIVLFWGEKSTILGFASCEGIFRTFLRGQKVRFEDSKFYNLPHPPVIHLSQTDQKQTVRSGDNRHLQHVEVMFYVGEKNQENCSGHDPSWGRAGNCGVFSL